MMQRKYLLAAIGLLVLVLVPFLTDITGQSSMLSLATRALIYGIAAASLNLVLGYGGMVSFGHAAFFGIGGYAVGILYQNFNEQTLFLGLVPGTDQMLLTLPAAMIVAAMLAAVIGALALRTGGVQFIMITMAFAQMVYYFFVSIDEYGADDGLVIDTRSELGLIDFDNPLQLYFFCLGSLVVAMALVHMIVNSRFGMVLQGAKGNNDRMVSLGYNTYLYRLVAYVISGAMCGFAGALLGNFTTFISPEMMDWSHSGELMFMVILGGASTAVGPILGSAAFIIIEEVLSRFTIYWHLPFGLMLLAVVLFARGGFSGIIDRLRGRKLLPGEG